MLDERCPVCKNKASFSDTVHLLIHTHTDVGVIDHYVCRNCFEEHIEPVFETEPAENSM